mgnify:CR=1 FL=1
MYVNLSTLSDFQGDSSILTVRIQGQNCEYCRRRFDSNSLTAVKIVTEKWLLSLEFAVEIMPIITYIGVVFPFMGSLSFLFLDDFEGNAKIYVTIKPSYTVLVAQCCPESS